MKRVDEGEEAEDWRMSSNAGRRQARLVVWSRLFLNARGRARHMSQKPSASSLLNVPIALTEAQAGEQRSGGKRTDLPRLQSRLHQSARAGDRSRSEDRSRRLPASNRSVSGSWCRRLRAMSARSAARVVDCRAGGRPRSLPVAPPTMTQLTRKTMRQLDRRYDHPSLCSLAQDV